MTEEATGAEEDSVGSVLVLAPDVLGAGISLCSELLAKDETAVDRVVPVTVSSSSDAWLDVWERRAGDSTARVTCIDVAELSRSAATSTAAPDTSVTVETVTDLTDLTELGTAVTDVVWEASASGERVGVCVHSLSDLLQHVERQQAFFFVITLADRARREGGIVYFHLDSRSHDEETIDVFRTACDAVFEAGGDAASEQ